MKMFGKTAAAAAALAGLAMFAGSVGATPLSNPGSSVKGGISQFRSGLVHKVYGCHPNKQHHMVYLWGYPAWHRHKQGCGPVPANPPGYAPGPSFGGGYYCHRNWQSHFHPGWGGGWHRHSKYKCRPVRGRRWKGGSRRGCVKIGNIWICG